MALLFTMHVTALARLLRTSENCSHLPGIEGDAYYLDLALRRVSVGQPVHGAPAAMRHLGRSASSARM